MANLNNAAGSNRANIEWGENVKNPQRLIGDTFSLPATASGAWKINSITIYSVGSGGQLGDEFSGVTLYLGKNGSPLTVAMAGTLNAGSSTNNNTNITHTPITYNNSQIYEGAPGIFYPLWATTFNFSSQNVILTSGVVYNFATFGVARNPSGLCGIQPCRDGAGTYGIWFNHASNAALSGSVQDGADNSFLVFPNLGDLTLQPSFVNPQTAQLWDKGSDVNIVIDGIDAGNQAPTALCQSVTVSGGAACSVNASIDSGSFDINAGDSITLSQLPSGPYNLGSTNVTLTATDNHNASSSCQATVTVKDTTAALTASPNSLWPPNHKMVPVKLNASGSGCGAVGATSCRITSITSNESGDGDWVITGNLTANLRSERSGNGSGRIYTITVQCTDAAGHSSISSTTVTVAHDKGDKGDDGEKGDKGDKGDKGN